MNSSKVYTLKGAIEDIDVDITQYNNQYIFKKETNSRVELEICRILMAHPYKNIVHIFEVGTNYVIMEQVNIDLAGVCNDDLLVTMTEVKTYLQNLGIIYIDWKPDNIGISTQGKLKLFDFDVSGLLDVHTQNWIINPKPYYAYNAANSNGFTTPIEIDNYCFNEFLRKVMKRKKTCSNCLLLFGILVMYYGGLWYWCWCW